MKKWIVTFGSSHLEELRGKVRPMSVILVIEADTENEARDIVFSSFIGRTFSASYPYSKSIEFQKEYNMVEYTLKQLEEMRDV